MRETKIHIKCLVRKQLEAGFSEDRERGQGIMTCFVNERIVSL